MTPPSAVEVTAPSEELAARVHVLASRHLHQLLAGPHVVGERPQQFLVASAVGADVRDMGINGAM
jgi:hypothetical protein